MTGQTYALLKGKEIPAIPDELSELPEKVFNLSEKLVIANNFNGF
jgi:hypothetical protein